MSISTLVLAGAFLLAMWLALGLSAPARADHASARYWDSHAEVLFQRIGRSAGLPSDIITGIAQDKAGFVWAGTPVGLARFDGYRFRLFQPDSRDPSSLPDGYINALHVDRRGRLWVATNNGGIVRFIPETESFARYPSGPGGLAHPTVLRLAEDPAGNIWAAMPSGVARIDASSGATTNFRAQSGRSGSLPGTTVLDLSFDASGNLWVATDGGLALWPVGGSEFVPAHQRFNLPSITPGAAISSLYADSRGRVWIGSRQGILVSVDPMTGLAHSFDMALPDGRRMDRPQIRGILDLGAHAGEDDRLWVATDPGGLLELDVESGSIRAIRHDPSVSSSISGDNVRSMMRDSAGLIWVATWGSGLNIHNPANRGVLSIFSSPSQPDSLSEAQVRSVMAASDGKVWLGYDSKGIDVIDPVTGERRRLEPGSRGTGSLPRASVLAMVEDGPDRVWIGTQLGLAVYSRATDQVRMVDLPSTLASAPIHSILVRRGELWLATEGLVRFNPQTGAIVHFRHDPDDATTLADDRVRVLALARNGFIWAGTHRGLHLIDPDSGHIRRVQNRSWDWSSLSHNYVTSLLHDRQGRLWVGTLGGGVSILDSDLDDEHYRFINLTQRNGLPGDSVQAMLLDDEGRVWINTEDGLASIMPGTRAVRTIGWDDGLAIQGSWIGAAARQGNGDLLFGGRDGLTVVRPQALQRWDYQPPLVLTEIRIDNEPQQTAALNLPDPAYQAADVGGKGVAVPVNRGGITLPAGAQSLTVSFSALDYAGPANVRYSYILEGFDRGWAEVDALGRTATYTNLPPGAYILRLRATNKEGVWAQSGRALSVTVLPAWYQTGWALAVAGLSVLVLLGVIIQARTAALRRQRSWLERLVEQRTRDLVKANEELVKLASTDPLTGLLNRRRFDDLAAAELDRARRYGRPFSLLLIDLDHFKQINDTFGHNAGDTALCHAAQAVSGGVRTTDQVSRYGGEELAVLLPETVAAEAVAVAERIRAAISGAPVVHDGRSFVITASVGAAEFGVEDDGVAQLLARADAALYRAKHSGRNRVVFDDRSAPYSSTMESGAAE